MKRRISVVSACGMLALLCLASPAAAQTNIFWNGDAGTNTGSWNTTADWWTTAAGTTPVGSFSGSTIIANFNATGIIGAQTITLDGGQAVQGLVFNGTDAGGETINSGSGSNTLTIGASGIVDNAGSGADTLGAVLSLSAAQTWQNTSAKTLSIGSTSGVSLAGSVTTAATLTINGSGATSIAGFVSDGGSAGASLGLTYTGTNTLTLAAANTYSGATTLSNNLGTLLLNFAAAGAPTNGNGIINNGITASGNNITSGSALFLGGGTLSIAGATTASATNNQAFNGTTVNPGLSNLAFTGGSFSNTINLDLGAITRTVAGGAVNFTQPLTGTANIYTTTPNPTFTGGSNNILGGWALYTNSGDTRPSTWATSAGAPGSAGLITAFSGYTTANATTALTAGADIDVVASSPPTVATSITINSLRFNSAAATTITGTAGQTITVASGGILETSNIGNFAVAINAGNLTTGNSADLIVNQYNTANTLTIGAIITGTTGLTKNGPGTVSLSATNLNDTFTGGTVVNGGTLILNGGNNGTGTVRGVLTVNAGGTLQTNTKDQFGFSAVATALNTLNINGGTFLLNIGANNETATGLVINMTGGTITTTNGSTDIDFFTNTGFGNTALNTLASSSTSVVFTSLGLRENSPTITVAQGTTPSGVDLLVSGAIIERGAGTGALVKAGLGTMALTGPNTFTRGLSINAGTVRLGNSLAVQSSVVTLSANNDLTFAPLVGTYVVGGLNGSSLSLVDSAGNPVTILVGSSNTTSTFAGALNGAGGVLVKVGTGSFTLSGTNSYGGGTYLAAGTLVANAAGALGTGSVNVFPGTTLNVAADANLPSGALTVVNRGTLAAGSAIDQTFVNAVKNSTNSIVVALGLNSGNSVDFSSATGANLSNASLGATGAFTYSGALTPFGTNYNLGGGGGTLTVSSTLADVGGPTSLTVGLNGTALGAVALSGPNTYSGGTTINAGSALVGISNDPTPFGALGTGSVTLGAASGDTTASLLTNGAFTFTNPITVATGSRGALSLGGATASTSTLSGSTITLNNNLTVSQLAAGTLNLNDAITSGTGGVQTLTFNNAGTVAVGGAIGGGTGTINVVQSGAGATTFSVANTYTGTTTVTAGTLTGGVAASIGSGNVIVAGGTLTESAANALMGASQTLTVNGGTATLGFANSYAGVTTVNGGTLNANITGAVGTGDVIVNGGTLSSTATSGTPLGAGNITLTGGKIAFAPGAAGTNSLTAAGTGGSLFNYGSSAVTAGGGTLSLSRGSGTSIALTVGNSAATTPIINRLGNGTLVIASVDSATILSALGTTDQLLIASTNAGAIPALTNGIVNTSIVGQSVTTASGDFLTYNTSTGFGIAIYGATSLALSSNTTVTNITTLQTNQPSSFAFALRAGANIVMNSGTTLTIGNPGTGAGLSPQAGLILDTSTISPASGTATLAFGAAEGTIYVNTGVNAISTGITGTGGITLFGPGTVTLSGAAANTYSGGTNIQGGVTANEGTVNQLSSGALSIDGGTLTNNGAATITPPTTQLITIGPGGATINASAANGFTSPAVSNWLGGSGPLTLTGSATTTSDLIIGTAQTSFAGNIAINSGRVQVTTATTNPLGTGTITIGATGELFISANPLTFNNPFIINSNGGEGRGAIRANSGNLTLTGPITMTANAGIVDDNGAYVVTLSGPVSGPFTLSFGSANGNGGAIYVPSNTANAQAATTLGTGTLQINSDANLGLSTGTLSLSTAGASTLQASSAAVILNANRPVVLTGLLTGNGRTTTFDTQANTLTINGPISETVPSASVTKIGSGTLVLGNANSFTGVTSVNAGVVQLAHPLALANSTVALQGTTNGLAFSPGIGTFTIGSLTGFTNQALTDTTGSNPITLQVGANSVSTTFNGALSGLGGLNKIGGGTLTLSTVPGGTGNTYGGTTTISSGTLAVNGSATPLSNGAIVLSGGRLQLQGIASGSIGIQFAGSSAPAAPLTSGQTAGAPAVAMSNWNTSTSNNGQATALALNFGSGNGTNSGLGSGATVTWTNPNGSFHTNSSGGTANTTLMSGYLDSNSVANRPSVTFANIPYSTYNVYVYTGSDTNGRQQVATATQGLNSTTYYYQTDANISFANPNAFVTTTTGNGAFPNANYLVFNGFNNSLPLNITAGYFNNNGGISAIEIVNTGSTAANVMSNDLSVTASSTIDVTGYSSGTISGPATIGNSSGGAVQFSVTGAGNGSGYALNLGATTLTGNNSSYVFDVLSSTGAATVNLGALSDGGNASTVVKQSSGTLNLTAGGSMVAGSLVNVTGGTLRVTNPTGSATGNAPITVSNGGTLAGPNVGGGLGSTAGAVTVNAGGTLTAGSPTGAATLTLSGGLTLQSGSLSTFTLSSTPNGTANPAAALIATSGGTGASLQINGSHTINLASAPPLQLTSTYDLFSYTGTQLTSTSPTGATLTFTNNGSGSMTLGSSLPQSNIFGYSLANNPHQIDLVVNLIIQTWTGQTGGTGAVNSSWDTSGSTNWANTTPAAISYTDGRAVQFADKNTLTSSNVPNSGGLASVSIQGAGVAPALVLFTNTGSVHGGVDYSLSGGPISGATSLLLNGSGGFGGQVTLDSANSFKGPVTISAGQLNLGDGATSGIDNALGQSSGVTVASGTSLNLNSLSGATVTFGNGWNGTAATGTATPLTLNGAGSGLSGILGALNSASGSNTYAGAIAIGSGGATIGSSSSSSGDQLTLSGGLTLPSGATLTIVGSGPTIFSTAPINIASGSGTINFSPTGSPALTISGGAVIANGGTLNLGGGGSTTVNTAAISGGGSLAYAGTGSGSLTLAGDNSYAGSTTISSNTVFLTSGNSLGNSSGVTVASGAALVLNNTNTTGNPIPPITFGNTAANATIKVPMTLNGAGSAMANGALASTSVAGAGNTYNGPITVGASNAATVASTVNGDSLTLAGGVAIPTGATLTITGPGNTTIGSAIYGTGPISGGGGLVVAPTGAGIVTLPTANTFGGGAVGTHLNSGTLAVASNTALSTGPVTMSGGTLQLQSVPVSYIGIKFDSTTRSANGPYPVTGTAGAPGLAIPNWNNEQSVAGAGGPAALNFSDNTVSGVTATWTTAGSTYDTFNATQANQDNQLMNAFLNITGNPRQISATIANIPSSFANYSIYAYVGAEVNNRNESVNIGSTTYFFKTDVLTAGNFVGYIPITNTDNTVPANNPAGNYAGLNGLTGSSQTVTVTDGGANSGLYALELVGYGAPTVSNALTINGSGAIDVTGPASANLTGAVVLGNSSAAPITLSVTGAGTGVGSNYSLALGSSVTLTGNNTNYIFDVANNSMLSGTGTAVVGSLNDGGAARTITVQNAGTMVLGSAGSLVAGSTVNVGPAGGGNGGSLRVTNSSGSATGNAAVVVNSGGTLLGSTAPAQGFISGPVTVGGGGTIGGGSGAALSLSGGLTLQASSISTFALGSPPNGTANPAIAFVAITGGGANNLMITGGHTINLTGTPTLQATSTYDLFSYSGTQLTSTSPTGSTLTFTNNGGGSMTLGSNLPGNGSFNYSLINGINQIDLIVTLNSITWTGQNNGTGTPNGSWDISTSNNWATQAPAATTYPDNVPVVFQDKNPLTNSNVPNVGGVTSVNIQAAGVSPATILFTNTGAAAGGVDYTFSTGGGPISGATGLAVSGAGGVTLQAANSFTGPVAVNAGHLQLQIDLALGNSSGVTVTSGGALELASGSGGSITYGNRADFTGTIGLTLNGPGLAGNAAGALNNISGNNTYAGPIGIGSSGAATIDSSSSANGDQLTLTGGVTLSSGATLTVGGSGNTTIATTAVTVGAGGGTINFSPIGSTPQLTISGGVNMASGTTLTFAGSGNTTINTLPIADGGAANAGSLRVTDTPTGSLTVADNNTYYGSTSINSGSAILSGANALGNSSGAIVASGATLELNNTSGNPMTFGATAANGNVTIPLTLNGPGLSGSPAGALNSFGGINTYAGPITIGASNAATIASNSTASGDGLTLTGGIAIPTGATLTFAGAGNTMVSGPGTISGGGALAVAATGTGIVSLATANTYGGGAVGTTITSGTLGVANSSALSTGPVTLSGGRLQMQLAPGRIIGVKFDSTTRSANGPYVVTGTAGAPGVAIPNWNNELSSTAGGGSASSLNFSNNTVSGATATWTTDTGSPYDAFNGNQANQDAQLMNAFLNTTGGNRNVSVTVSNIPFPAYSIYAYVGCDANNRNESVNIGGTTYYFNTDVNNGGFVGYIPITNTNSTLHPVGNYAVFSGLTGSSQTVLAHDGGANSGLFAVEVIGYEGPTVSNALTVNGSGAIDVTGPASASLTGTVTLGNTGGGPIQLSVTGTGTGSGSNYSLTLGSSVTLAGTNTNYVFDVANNGSGTGTAVMGALSDGGAAHTITVQNAGTMVLGSAGSLLAGSTVNVGPAGGGNFGNVQVTNASGSATGSAAVVVNSGGTLLGATSPAQGFISGPVAVGSGGTVAGGSGATLSLSGGLTLQAGSLSTFALGTPPNGTANPAFAFVATSNLLVPSTGSHTINLTGTPAVQATSTYDLFSYTSAQLTAAQFSHLTLGASLPFNGAYNYALFNGSKQVDLIVTLIPLTWTGANSGGGVNSSWDTSGSTNWANATPAAASYIDGAAVIFANKNPLTGTNVATSTVNVQSGGVSPASMTFTNTTAAGVDYTFTSASGPINGLTGLTLNGAGGVTLQMANNFSGAVFVNAGHLQLQNAAALGNAAGVAVAAGAALELASGSGTSAAYGNLANAGGTIGLTLDGAGLTAAPAGALNSVSGINTYTGPVTVGGSGAATIASNSNANGDSLTLTGGVNLASGATLSVAGGGSTTIATNPISVGAGGATVINSASALLTSSGGANLADGTTLTLGGTGRTTFTTLPISGNASVKVNGSGAATVSLTTGNTYTSGTTVTGGTLAVSNNSALGTGQLTLSSGRLQLQNVPPASIGIKFATGRGGEVPPNETFVGTAGAPATVGPSAVMSNWNNLLVGTSALPFPLADSNLGATAGAVAAFSSADNYSVYGAPQPQGSIQQFFNSYLDVNPYVNVTGVPFQNYSVFVYLGSDANNRTGRVAIFPGTNVTTGTPAATYYYTTNANHGATTAYAQTTDTTGATNPLATYAEFDNVSASSFSLQGANGSGNNGIFAVEIVPTVSGAAAILSPSISNAVVVNGSSTVDISGPPSATLSGAVTVGNTSGAPITLSVTGLGTGAGTDYALSMSGGLSLSGNNSSYTLDVANNSGGGGSGTLFLGSLSSAGSTTAAPTIVKANSGTLQVNAAPNLANNTVLQVNAGKLRFNATTGSATIGTLVSASVSGSASLELAGTVSALSSTVSPANRVNISNTSSSSAGLLVSGTNQQVGAIDGTGTTQVNDGSDLTANHIVQGALVIGVTGSSPSLVTIAASDANGNALAESSGLALAGSLATRAPFASGTLSSASLPAASDASSGGGAVLGGSALGGLNVGGSSAAVPEPSTLALLGLGGLGGLGCLLARLRRGKRGG